MSTEQVSQPRCHVFGVAPSAMDFIQLGLWEALVQLKPHGQTLKFLPSKWWQLLKSVKSLSVRWISEELWARHRPFVPSDHGFAAPNSWFTRQELPAGIWILSNIIAILAQLRLKCLIQVGWPLKNSQPVVGWSRPMFPLECKTTRQTNNF